jgi:ParB family chromosome partitioning protein
MRALFIKIVSEGISVRGLEKMLSVEAEQTGSSAPEGDQLKKLKPAQIRKMEEKLMSKLGTKVEIKHTGKKGRIEISYYSLEDFERIVEIFK